MKSFSLKARMILASFAVLFVVFGSGTWLFRTVSEARVQAVKYGAISSRLGDLRQQFDEMTIGMRGFLLDPSNKAEWESKVAADEKAVELLGQASKISIDPAVTELLQQIAAMDEQVMNRLENEFGELVRQGRNDRAQALYLERYKPTRAKMEGMLRKAEELADQGFKTADQKFTRSLEKGGVAVMTIITVSLLCSFFFNLGVAQKLTKSLLKLTEQLSNSVLSIELASKNTASASQQIATSATENASAITETLSISEAGKRESERGRSVVAKMNESMEQVYESNQKLESLIKVIDDIQTKTKVINDIVFETRLLSFNASIEAARAGTHGKGFAVVAEEVGKLAAVSGKAAEEINALLTSSTHQVKEIVLTTSQKVNTAKDTATQCSEVFTQMNHSMSEINHAMTDMERETHQNSASSEEMANQAQTLAMEAKSLTGLLGRLKAIVSGKAQEDVGGEASVLTPAERIAGLGRSSDHKSHVIPMPVRDPVPTSLAVDPSDAPVIDRNDHRWKTG
ncbi:MAG: hypothetical protein RJB38_445 [Pseudomonadota bacterium]|jgi:methyl-accepting chemotaxis protein